MRTRYVKYIVVHCSATSQSMKIEDLQRYWRIEKGKHNPIYHYIIERNGNVVQIAEHSRIAGVTKGFNSQSIHVCYMGGITKDGSPIDNRTEPQQESLFYTLVKLADRYKKAKILGYRDLPSIKAHNPNFDVQMWLKTFTPSVLVQDIDTEEKSYKKAA